MSNGFLHIRNSSYLTTQHVERARTCYADDDKRAKSVYIMQTARVPHALQFYHMNRARHRTAETHKDNHTVPFVINNNTKHNTYNNG